MDWRKKIYLLFLNQIINNHSVPIQIILSAAVESLEVAEKSVHYLIFFGLKLDVVQNHLKDIYLKFMDCFQLFY